ncbi:MAG: RnfH family protein [Gammaproteobacteria bacterium]
MQIEIVSWEAEREQRQAVTLPTGSTVADALRESRLDAVAAEWILQSGAIGLKGRLASWDQVLEDGDRIEFLHPLETGARELRRKRAHAARRMELSRSPSGKNPLGVADDPYDSTVVKNDLKPDHSGA